MAAKEMERDVQSSFPDNPSELPPIVEHRVSEIATLLKSLDDVAAESGQSTTRQPTEHEDKLVRARLGVAGGLFTALRCKHAPTTSHSLRVALGCSSWAMALEIPESYRDALDVAALLHDIGKIGIPDHILTKPARLLPEEVATMSRHRQMAVDILAGCCASSEVIDIVRYASAWFDGSRGELEHSGSSIPLGARMLAIVDAFDAMITDHVYRPARPRERALAELFEFSGTQFDPQLVRNFHDLHSNNSDQLCHRVADHWLRDLVADDSCTIWKLPPPQHRAESDIQPTTTSPFESVLIDNMHDGVMFIDNQQLIIKWNTGAERLTGVLSDAAIGRIWKPELLDIRDQRGKRMADENCPVANTLQTGVQSIQRLSILGRNGRDVIIDLHVIPIRGDQNEIQGATVLFQDASPEVSLEERCLALHEKATKDPLTQIANRAEFDRMHQLFIDAHLESGLPCSLIITDIDKFKNVNDTHGHQAGDVAIISFASLLKSMCRTGDLVARYGGEEFVVLCTDCNNSSAAKRANEIRKQLGEMKHAALGNRSFTASFGVTELQPGDTPATMLRRADRGLLQAKDQGRNQVVQLGDGMSGTQQKRSWWPFAGRRAAALVEADYVTIVPFAIAVEKLRGFIADHGATIVDTGEDYLQLEVTGNKAGIYRRDNDRTVPFVIDMQFNEQHVERSNAQGFAKGEYVETHVHVVVRPQKSRDRRREEAIERARLLLVSMKSYLMAKDEEEHAASIPAAQPV